MENRYRDKYFKVGTFPKAKVAESFIYYYWEDVVEFDPSVICSVRSIKELSTMITTEKRTFLARLGYQGPPVDFISLANRLVTSDSFTLRAPDFMNTEIEFWLLKECMNAHLITKNLAIYNWSVDRPNGYFRIKGDIDVIPSL